MEAEEKPAADVALSFKDMTVEQVCRFIGTKLGKPVIPHASVKQKKPTIISDKKRTLEEALRIITVALRQQGVIYHEYTDHIEFLPISELARTRRPVIPADQSVAEMKDHSNIVDRIFNIKHDDATNLNQVILSMLPDFAFVVTDPNVNRLIVTDTVENLLRIEQIVARLDVPLADKAHCVYFSTRGCASPGPGIQ